MTKVMAITALCVALVACQPGDTKREFAYSVVKDKHSSSKVCGNRPDVVGVKIGHYTMRGNRVGGEIQCVPLDVANQYDVGDQYP